jgi:serine/threonine-protein kinase
MEFTPQSLAQRVIDLGLADSSQIDQVWAELRRANIDLDTFKTALLRKGVVTNFQLDRLLTGERLGFFYGPYKVLYMIGAGTFARVYRAVHRETGRVVAVKVLRRRHRDDPRQVEQFLREGKMGLQLRHPNIVSIYDIVNDSRTPYLVMEFVEGETLREILKIRKQFDPVSALKIMTDVCSGLDHASRLGITHRDLKLSNVLVSASGRCKLVDFGLAAMADTSTPEALADCPSARAIDYAALERGTGVRKDDVRSDLYFAGCILYHILAGASPLTETRDRLARLNVSRFREVKPLGTIVPSLPQLVLSVVSKSMEIDPMRRYQTPAEMLGEIQLTLRKLESADSNTKATTTTAAKEPASPEEDFLEGNGFSVMLVESKMDLQDLVREKLKSRGYRVLVFSDPARALERFSPEEPPPAHCLILSAPELGNLALDAFNRMLELPHLRDLPAILLVDRKQQHIIRSAEAGPKRILLPMPLKVRDLRVALIKLLGIRLPAASRSEPPSQEPVT